MKFLDNEFWYGGFVKYGVKMPISKKSDIEYDLSTNITPNQAMPIFLSTKGRVIKALDGGYIAFKGGEITLKDGVIETVGKNLKDAYLYAERNYFPFNNKKPNIELFEKPIYNSWIELTFYQNREDILKYAKNILASGLPSGVLMIDDGWSEYYGDWRFHSGKFPRPKEMLDDLRKMGFNVMLWICPFISPDSVAYREARDKGLLIKNPDGSEFITSWWNGHSAVLDMSNPKAVGWLKAQLDDLVELGVKGFKFDAGDSIYYRADNVTFGNTSVNEQSRLWAKFAENYDYNELRATYMAGGYGLLQRLCDKEHSFGESGLASLVPDTLLQGITGHPYGCPDMIGGGEYLNFIDCTNSGLDEEIFVRHGEIASLMPAMQFSALPSRVLSKENNEAILKSVKLREKYLPYILKLINEIDITKEPIVRYLAYEFPQEPVETIIDEFILGNKYLVAPIYKKGEDSREVYIPKGKWKISDEIIDSNGMYKNIEGKKGEVIVLERL